MIQRTEYIQQSSIHSRFITSSKIAQSTTVKPRLNASRLTSRFLRSFSILPIARRWSTLRMPRSLRTGAVCDNEGEQPLRTDSSDGGAGARAERPSEEVPDRDVVFGRAPSSERKSGATGVRARLSILGCLRSVCRGVEAACGWLKLPRHGSDALLLCPKLFSADVPLLLGGVGYA